jgi:hypothetical protein
MNWSCASDSSDKAGLAWQAMQGFKDPWLHFDNGEDSRGLPFD